MQKIQSSTPNKNLIYNNLRNLTFNNWNSMRNEGRIPLKNYMIPSAAWTDPSGRLVVASKEIRKVLFHIRIRFSNKHIFGWHTIKFVPVLLATAHSRWFRIVINKRLADGNETLLRSRGLFKTHTLPILDARALNGPFHDCRQCVIYTFNVR